MPADLVIFAITHKSYETAKPLKSGDAKLKGLKSRTMPASYRTRILLRFMSTKLEEGFMC